MGMPFVGILQQQSESFKEAIFFQITITLFSCNTDIILYFKIMSLSFYCRNYSHFGIFSHPVTCQPTF